MVDNIALRKVSLYSNGLMLLTTIHHIYGAIVYNTPWRLHVLMLSLPVIAATVLLKRVLIQKPNSRWWLWTYCVIILVPSFGLIGLFEGMYNHVAKVVMFYTSVNRATLLTLFPPPTYELPNDFVFEFTGVLQGVLAFPLAHKLYRLIKSRTDTFRKSDVS